MAQAPAIQWQKSLGGSSDEYANDIQITYDGGYITAGYALSNNGNVSGNHGGKDYWVVKLDASGNIQWQKSYGGSRDDEAFSLYQSTDSGYVVAGYSMSDDGDITNHHGGTDTSDYWIVKLNAGGTIQWENSFGGTDYDAAASIQQTADSGYIVAGFTQSVNGDITLNHGNSDYWILKLTATGTIQWQHAYGGTSWDNATSIQQTADSGFIVAGNAYSADGDVSFNHGLSDYWMLKLNATGTIQWEKSYGGSDNEYPYNVRQTAGNGYIIAGQTVSTDGDVTQHYAPPEYWIVKTDPAGTIQWEKSYGGQGSDYAGAVEQTNDGGYIAAGTTSSFDFDVTGNHGVNDCWIVKSDSAGAIQWELCYGGPWDDGATSIHQTTDGGYIFAGHSMLTGGDVTNNNGAHDFWIVKLNATVGMNEITGSSNITIYPNPAKNEITVYAKNFPEGTVFTVTDRAGKEILTGRLNNKSSRIAIDKLTPGIYIFRAGQFKQLFEKIKK